MIRRRDKGRRGANRCGAKNEESGHPDVFVCREPRRPWPKFWKALRHFG